MATVTKVNKYVYQALRGEIVALKPRAFFGLMGEDTAALTTDLALAGIPYFAARQEGIAVAMADGYAWATGELGICLVTRGPGVTNAMTAARTAVRGGRPVLIITGDAATTGEREHDLKYVDQAPVASSIGLAFYTASRPSAVIGAFREALATASSGQTALLAIPVDVLNGASEGTDPSPATVRAPAAPPLPEPSEAEVRQIADLLAMSRRPLLLAGRGASTPGCRHLLETLAERTGALLGTSLLAKDLFRGHLYNLGVVGGFSSDPAAGLLAEVDCVVVFGASLTPFTTAQRTLFKGATVVQVDVERDRLNANFPVQLGVVADALVTVKRLLGSIPEAQTKDKPFHSPETLQRLARPLYDGPDESTADELDPRMVAMTLDQLLPEERTIILDSGRFMTSPGRFMHVRGPQAFRLTAQGGSIGVGYGVALGAAVARPGDATVLFIGDGGMSMMLGDLETAARHRIPLIIAVMNDRAYGAEHIHLAADGLPTDCSHFPDTDFAGVASALGIESATVRTLAELRSQAPKFADRAAPLLLDCKIRQDLTATRLTWDSKE
jgi:thiamine pyrophosphate-dependent acetolactate synthase large subunit-like protein